MTPVSKRSKILRIDSNGGSYATSKDMTETHDEAYHSVNEGDELEHNDQPFLNNAATTLKAAIDSGDVAAAAITAAESFSENSTSFNNVPRAKKSGYPRASKACDACRKQKTRCLASPGTTACLRCLSMRQKCSFEEDDLIELLNEQAENGDITRRNVPLEDTSLTSSQFYHLHNQQHGRFPNRGTSIDSKLSYLQMGMNEVLFMLRNNTNVPIGGQNPTGNGTEKKRTSPTTTTTTTSTAAASAAGEGSAKKIKNDNSSVSHSIPLLGDDSNISKILSKRQWNEGKLSKKPKIRKPKTKKKGIESLANFSPKSFITSPYFAIGQMTSNSTLLPRILSDLVAPSMQLVNNVHNQQDLINLKLLTYSQAKGLLQHFRDRYGRWVTFPDDYTNEMILDRVRVKCPFFLTVACTLALKYSDPYLKEKVYGTMLEILRKDLNNCLLNLPLNIEFLQAICVLSLYGLCLSNDDDLQLDNWFLSGVGIQHFLKLNSMGILFANMSAVDNSGVFDEEFQNLTVFRLWNHLSLVHLINCIVSGRPCVSEEVTETLYLKTLDLPSSTNFDGRIVAEIQLHIMTYLYLHHEVSKKINDGLFAGEDGGDDDDDEDDDDEDEDEDEDEEDDGYGAESNGDPNGVRLFHDTKDRLEGWLSQWGYLFEQPANEFVSMAYHFSHLMVSFSWNFKKCTTNKRYPINVMYNVINNPVVNGTQEDLIGSILSSSDLSSLNSMIYHSQKILDSVSSVEDDSYFAFLSDQIRVCILFTSLILIKLTYSLSERKKIMKSIEGVNMDTTDISNTEIHRNLNRCYRLAKRFRIISTDEIDAVNRFSDLIQDCLLIHFPNFTSA